MANNKIIRVPNRKLLEQIFGKNSDLIRQYENLFSISDEIIEEINRIEEAVGLDSDGNYVQPTDTRFLNDTITVMEALSKLDEEIGSIKILNIDVSSSTLPINQLLIVDATSGNITITLPDPTEFFINNNSKTISITKKDISTNIVTIEPYGTEEVVGETSQELFSEGDVINLITDGTDWYLGA